MSRFRRLRSIAGLVLQLGILATLIAAFFIRMPQVSGGSMEPHIASGEYVLINTLAYRFGVPHRDDIVAFMHDGDPPETYIKRVIGVAGDRIRIMRGTVYVNERRLNEPYVRYADTRSYPEVVVPPSHLFVLGDNRAISEDSRIFGTIGIDRLMGKALAGIWPVGALGAL